MIGVTGVRPRAVYFGDTERPLFGQLHVADPAIAKPLGIVLCNPFGHEALSIHRTYRHLSNRCAEAGISAMRFDYDGTGDSAGDDRDPGRLPAWIRSVQFAIDHLVATTGVPEVCLFGIRLGAYLALRAAVSNARVRAVIAVDPVCSGAKYLRELRVMALTGAPCKEVDPDVLESGGFEITTETQAALRAIDLRADVHALDADIFLLDAPERGLDKQAVAHIKQLGRSIRRMPFSGFADMLQSPHTSVVPHDALRGCVDLLSSLRASRSPMMDRSTSEPTLNARNVGLGGETVVQFGTDESLFGILTSPVDKAASDGTALILLNTGAEHRIGPCRISVRIARETAELGIWTLRFDIPGLGDSPRSYEAQENRVYPGDALAAIAAAIAHLRTERGARRIVCAGICSGGYHSLKAIVGALDVDAAVVINPMTFFWDASVPLSYHFAFDQGDIDRYRARTRDLRAWFKLFAGQVDLVHAAKVVGRKSIRKLNIIRRNGARALGIPLHKDLAGELRTLRSCNGRVHFIFADGEAGIQLLHEHDGSTLRALQRSGHIQISYIDGADHTFTRAAPRRLLIARIHEAIRSPHISTPPEKKTWLQRLSPSLRLQPK